MIAWRTPGPPYWVDESFEREDHRLYGVIRANAILSLERRKLLGSGGSTRLLNTEEHEQPPLGLELGFQTFDAVEEARVASEYGVSFLWATGGS